MARNSIMESWAIQAWDEFRKTNDDETVAALLSFDLNDAVELYETENKEVALIQIESVAIIQFGYSLSDGQNNISVLKNVMELQAFINMKEEQQEPFDIDQFKKDLDAAGEAASEGKILATQENELEDLDEEVENLIDQIYQLVR